MITPIVTNKKFAAAGDAKLKSKTLTNKTLLTFNGQATGSVTITARVPTGAKFNAVTDGTIDLASRDYILIDGPVEEVRLAFTGSFPLNMVATQY